MHPQQSEPLLPIYNDALGAARYEEEQKQLRAKMEQQFGMGIGKPCRIYLKSLDKPLEGRLLLHTGHNRFYVTGFNTTFTLAEIESYVRLD